MSKVTQQTRPEPERMAMENTSDRRSQHALDLDAFIPAHLTYLSQNISASASALYRPRFGVGITDWRIMAFLAVEPWTAAARICEHTGLDKGAVSRSLRDLVAAALVEVRAGRANQRNQPVALTHEGLAVHDDLVKLAREREERLLAGFSPEDRATLINLMMRMRANVEVSPRR